MSSAAPEGIILIDKPVGMTSFDVIRQMRCITGIRKFGHAGTLDPLASGLMVLGYQAGTKQLHGLSKLDKLYEAEILIGQSRSTSDMEGTVVEETALSEQIPQEKVQTTLGNMVGELDLSVSAYSAIKRDGTPLYRLAREAAAKGDVFADVPVRTMRVYEAALTASTCIEFDAKQFQLISVRFRVGSGTYIRSLAEEIGTRLGYPACLYSLRRTEVGMYQVDQAYQLTDEQGIQKALGQ